MPGSGYTTVNFGAFPGCGEAEADVSGQSGYVSTSLVEAWVMPIATADHTVDDHVIENIAADARFKTNGTFTVRAFPSNTPTQEARPSNFRELGKAQPPLLYGQFTIGWAWK